MTEVCVSRIGVDEAGLGPTLGPLVVGCFATNGWPADIAEVLGEAIGPPGRTTRPPRIEVGDSKLIHSGPRRLARLEHTVLSTLAWIHGGIPSDAASLVERVCLPVARTDDRTAPWYGDLAEALPVAASMPEILESASLLARLGEEWGVEPPTYRADLYPARRINRELRDEILHPDGSKNTWATAAVLRSLRHALRPGAVAWCDKAGGRQAYQGAISRAFPEVTVDVQHETRERSLYTLDFAEGSAQVGFLMKGDRLDLHVSWASCLAKYVRELVMRAFNRYFAARLPDLRPTAGYPEDARRFIDDVRSLALDGELGAVDWIRDR